MRSHIDRHSLRFAASSTPALPPGLLPLHAHLLSQRPSPLPYLHAYPPALYAYASLLTITPPHPRLLRVATSSAAVSAPTAKEAATHQFITAVSSVPARIPAELRNALTSHEKLQPVALVAAFAAFYTTTCALLGLHEQRSAEANASDITESISGRVRPESELDAVSISSSAASFPFRLAQATKLRLSKGVASPLKQRFATRAVRRTQRHRWLANVPLQRRSQDDFVRAAMGFAPRYLAHVKSSVHRAVFVYVLDEILLRESVQVSVPLKQLVCYVLARSAENDVLTAHAAFLANRFGADDRQLAACMDVQFLNQVHRMYQRRGGGGSTATSSSSCVSSPPRSPPPPPPPQNGVRKRRRSSLLEERLEGVWGRVEGKMQRSFSERKRKGGWGRMEDREVEPTSHVRILPEEEGGRRAFRRVCSEGLPDLSIDESQSEMSDGEDVTSLEGGTETSFLDLGDDPEVPEVCGLNSMEVGGGDDGFGGEFYSKFTLPTDEQPVEVEEEFLLYEDDVEAPLEIDHSVFSEREVAVLLLAHDVAKASRRNSRRMARSGDTSPGRLVTPLRAALIHDLFDADAIMEIVAVFASFQLLQRWTVCYPYRPGSLEAPVRRFMQTPIAHDLCVASVGQRSSSKSSVGLRSRRGRALRLPKHVLVGDR